MNSSKPGRKEAGGKMFGWKELAGEPISKDSYENELCINRDISGSKDRAG